MVFYNAHQIIFKYFTSKIIGKLEMVQIFTAIPTKSRTKKLIPK